MADDITVLASRRGYEFAPDALRLAALSTVHAIQHVQQTLGFQAVQPMKPQPTFGPVPDATPPGVVFQTGSVQVVDKITPIRFINFEQNRIVIEVAGTSDDIDPVFMALRDAVLQLTFSVDQPVIPEPIRERDFSAVRAHMSSPLDAIFNPLFRALVARAFDVPELGNVVIAPTLVAQTMNHAEIFVGATSPGVELAYRIGTAPEERVIVSGAFLRSDAHADYLQDLDEALIAQ